MPLGLAKYARGYPDDDSCPKVDCRSSEVNTILETLVLGSSSMKRLNTSSRLPIGAGSSSVKQYTSEPVSPLACTVFCCEKKEPHQVWYYSDTFSTSKM